MIDTVTALAALLLVISVSQFGMSLIARRSVPLLGAVTSPDASPGRAPHVSIVVAARNEARDIEAALLTLVGQDYPHLEIIVVNDRSTDDTGAIIDRLAAQHPRIRALHLTELPPGWLGKNHALWRGAQLAAGDWLLFTDADIHFLPDTVRRAVAFAEARGLDHLTMVPRLATLRSYWLECWVQFFVMAFQAYKLPHLANNPRSRVGLGVGAFNLVRRDAYARLGTHEAISLRPDDDLRLGQRLKRLGMKQFALIGAPFVEVAWYRTLGEAVRGLEKNTFAGLEYSVPMVLFAIVGLLGLLVVPYIAVFFLSGLAFWFCLGAIVAQLATYVASNEWQGPRSLLLAIGMPVAAVLFTYTIARSAWLTVRQGGIYWRDTFYPLAELRAQSGFD